MSSRGSKSGYVSGTVVHSLDLRPRSRIDARVLALQRLSSTSVSARSEKTRRGSYEACSINILKSKTVAMAGVSMTTGMGLRARFATTALKRASIAALELAQKVQVLFWPAS
jgi:hypothetical protein